MFNPFVMKKWAAIITAGALPAVAYNVGSMYYGLWGGVGFFIGGLLIGLLIGVLLLKNPFTLMLEGKGILAINLDSTGVIHPFIVRVNSPYITGKVNGAPVNDVFDRDAVFNLAEPQKEKCKAVVNPDGSLTYTISQETLNKGRFAMFHYPVLLWNDQIKSILTKDWLAEKEKTAFAEHGVLYLNRKMEELTSLMRDFGRYVVELLKPKGSMWGNWWVWLIIIVVIGVLIMLFAPSIINAFKGAAPAASAAGGSVQTAINATRF